MRLVAVVHSDYQKEFAEKVDKEKFDRYMAGIREDVKNSDLAIEVCTPVHEPQMGLGDQRTFMSHSEIYNRKALHTGYLCLAQAYRLEQLLEGKSISSVRIEGANVDECLRDFAFQFYLIRNKHPDALGASRLSFGKLLSLKGKNIDGRNLVMDHYVFGGVFRDSALRYGHVCLPGKETLCIKESERFSNGNLNGQLADEKTRWYDFIPHAKLIEE